MATEDSRNEAEKECLYKTKVIQFLGRTTSIILQNDNGPCPLLAICNVLLLKNQLNLSLDVSEISLQKLLSLVAERLIDSNSNTENKDVGYLENQQQNIADSIDLLPRLATGIDVNIKFRRIDDFEFTRECAIFDLLDIPLYHGWIVDPQDIDSANAIGSKSYNTLTGELVALETRITEGGHKSNPEEDCIDFAAATTATLGVPSPCLSRGASFDDSPHPISGQQKGRKGDLEEEEELLRVLKLSGAEQQTPVDEPLSADTNGSDTYASSDDNTLLKGSSQGILADSLEGHPGDEHLAFHQPEPTISQASQHCSTSSCCNNGGISLKTISEETDKSFSKIDAGSHFDLPSSEEHGEPFVSSDLVQNIRTDELAINQSEPSLFSDGDSSSACRDHLHGPGGGQQVQQTCLQDTSTSVIHLEPVDNQGAIESTVLPGSSAPTADSDHIGGSKQNVDVPESAKLSLNDSEPIYEGEECILDSGLTTYENREPIYEGEMVLADQADRSTGDTCDVHPKDEITKEAGDLIRNFLKNNASQLTIYGLFCLQEGLKERELCVFFRNNHFSTLFKLNGELYLLATDQGYINQPDLVWEKLNEVNGDTVFMTGNFMEFKAENHASDTWNEQNAMATTADYLAGIDNSASAASTLNSDLQLAIALQQQEFENQPQRQHNSQQSSAATGSRLVTGPQVPRSSSNNSSSKQDAKSKDKCIVM